MTDPSTALGAGFAVLASKDLITKLLGPTAEYIGSELRHLAEKANLNLDSIFNRAMRKLGNKIDTPGSVSPRVLKQVWDEGRFVEDELAAEYFGGLMASARSPDGKDDRVLSLLATVRDLSVFEIRLHYLTYTLIRRVFAGKSFCVTEPQDRLRSGIFMPFRVYMKAMGISPGLSAQELASHSLITLTKEVLIDPRFTMGPVERLKPKWPHVTEPGLMLIPSLFGAELYLWAHGRSDCRIDHFLSTEFELISDVSMTIEDGTLPMQYEDNLPNKANSADRYVVS